MPRLRRIRVALPPVESRLLIAALVQAAREEGLELSLLLPPGSIASPNEWGAPLVIGIEHAAIYPLSAFIHDISLLDCLVSEYMADEMHGIYPSDHLGDSVTMPLGFVHIGFERSANDVFKVPRMMYVKYPNDRVWGMLTLEEGESMPSYEEARERLTRPILRSSGHGSSGHAPLANMAGDRPDVEMGSTGVYSDSTDIIQLNDRAVLKGMVSSAIDSISATELSKVVISWRETFTFSGQLTLLNTLFSMKENEPDCWLLAFTIEDHTRADYHRREESVGMGDTERDPGSEPEGSVYMIGATPELVLSRVGNLVTSSPLAGTLSTQMASKYFEQAEMSHDESEANDEYAERLLLDSSKNRLEHSLTVGEIVSIIDRYCTSVAHSRQPGIIRLASVIHLETVINGVLRADMDRPNTTLKLLNDLHPTPAVAGVPREIAMKKIAELEKQPRNQYAGITGWLASNGDGFSVLNIRTAVIAGDQVTIQAGAGIVGSSDVDDEVLEIEAKLRSIIRLLPL